MKNKRIKTRLAQRYLDNDDKKPNESEGNQIDNIQNVQQQSLINKKVLIMIIGSAFNVAQENNALFDRLKEEKCMLNIFSYDVKNENLKSDFDKEKITRILNLPQKANETYYCDQFKKNIEEYKPDVSILIDGIGTILYENATHAFKEIFKGHKNIIFLDWCTCCLPAQIIDNKNIEQDSDDENEKLTTIIVNSNMSKPSSQKFSQKYSYKIDNCNNIVSYNNQINNKFNKINTEEKRQEELQKISTTVVDEVIYKIKEILSTIDNTKLTEK